MSQKQIDEVTGIETTGHEWDGLSELNSPLPRWWVISFWVCTIWAIGYWVVMPAWPLLTDHTKGVLNYSSRAVLESDMSALRAKQAVSAKPLANASLKEIVDSPDMLSVAKAIAKPAFGDNCAPCHGTGASGAIGYPDLNDDDWLWGGSLEAIQTTINVGIRDKHDDTRLNDMPAFGKDEILDDTAITNVAGYVMSLSGGSIDGADVAAGKTVFVDNCVACHGEDGKGGLEDAPGAPNLTDAIWLYGGDAATVIDTIKNARKGVMPTWAGRLDPVTIKALTVYVHSLGGGK